MLWGHLLVLGPGGEGGEVQCMLTQCPSVPPRTHAPSSRCRAGEGKALHFKGAPFYRIIDQFIDQAGIDTDSVFGGTFKDDYRGLRMKHDKKGLLSMANAGPNTNTAHFSIMMGPAPHLNGFYTVFGQAVTGFEVRVRGRGRAKACAIARDGQSR